MSIKRYHIDVDPPSLPCMPDLNGEWVKYEDLEKFSNLIANGLVLLNKFNATKNPEYISAIEGILFTLQSEIKGQ